MDKQHSSKATRTLRTTRLIVHTLYGVFIAGLIFPFIRERQREIIISRWSKGLLAVMNIRLIARGILPDRNVMGTLFVGNHISWIDIHALNSLRAVRFVAKSEVRDWPVFGWLAAKANTLFTEREKKQDAGRIVETITTSLKNSDCLCYFPEGTTTDGTELKPFKRSLMQAAIDANTPIWPFSVSYPKANGEPNVEMAYYGDMSLLRSIQLILMQQSPTVILDFSLPINPKGHDRRGLAIMARQAIASRLNFPES
ncbi:MAG: lysophospholipid acyltransferase family protein [Methylophilaceae bacterium]